MFVTRYYVIMPEVPQPITTIVTILAEIGKKLKIIQYLTLTFRWHINNIKDGRWSIFKVKRFFCNAVIYIHSLRSKRNINDLKSIDPCAFY